MGFHWTCLALPRLHHALEEALLPQHTLVGTQNAAVSQYKHVGVQKTAVDHVRCSWRLHRLHDPVVAAPILHSRVGMQSTTMFRPNHSGRSHWLRHPVTAGQLLCCHLCMHTTIVEYCCRDLLLLCLHHDPEVTALMLNSIKVHVFFRKTHLCRHEKNYYFWKSNIHVINLIAGSRNMIKLLKNMSF